MPLPKDTLDSKKKICLTLTSNKQKWNSTRQDEGQKKSNRAIVFPEYRHICQNAGAKLISLEFAATGVSGDTPRLDWWNKEQVKKWKQPLCSGHHRRLITVLQLTPISTLEDLEHDLIKSSLSLSYGLAWVWSGPCAAGCAHQSVLFDIPTNMRVLSGQWASYLQQQP